MFEEPEPAKLGSGSCFWGNSFLSLEMMAVVGFRYAIPHAIRVIQDRIALRRWRRTRGVIRYFAVVGHSWNLIVRLELGYHYRVKYQTFGGMRTRAGDYLACVEREDLEARIIPFQVNRAIVVLYDPKKPANSMIRRSILGSTLPLALAIAGGTVGVAGLAWLLRLAWWSHDPIPLRLGDIL